MGAPDDREVQSCHSTRARDTAAQFRSRPLQSSPLRPVLLGALRQVSQALLQGAVDGNIQRLHVAAQLLDCHGSAQKDICPGLIEHYSECKRIWGELMLACRGDQRFFCARGSKTPISKGLFDDDTQSPCVCPLSASPAERSRRFHVACTASKRPRARARSMVCD
jgi:hypothetical protein